MTIERREQFLCACGCANYGPISRFTIVEDHGDRFPVLPEHSATFRERLAATKQLIELVATAGSWRRRVSKCSTVFRLQMAIRNNTRIAWRSATLFALPKWLGLKLGPIWRLKA